MRYISSAKKAPRKSEPTPGLLASAGPQGVVLVPPTYGLEVVDRGPLLQKAASAPAEQQTSPVQPRPLPSGAIQAKLAINPPGDIYEQEADRVAEQVMRMPTPAVAPLQRRAANQVGSPTAPTIVHEALGGSGQPLDSATRAYFEPRFGADFSGVRVHTDAQAAESARAVNALAYTLGQDVVFGAGQYRPGTSVGQRLLAHELTHAVQQNLAANLGSPQAEQLNKNGQARNTHQSHQEPLAARVQLSVIPGKIIQRKPQRLIENFDFLGNRVGGGISPTLRDRLVDVQKDLRQQYDAMKPEDKAHPGGDPMSFEEWAGVTSIQSWRPGKDCPPKCGSFHYSGSAVDVNYHLQPYIATRTLVKGVPIYGGEAAGAHLQSQRKAAAEAYDRAAQFMGGSTHTADVSERSSGETTRAVYTRFIRVSVALQDYFSFAFRYEPTAVKRQPIADIEGATEADLLSAIPTTERLPEDEAVKRLESFMNHHQFRQSHPNWPHMPREQYFRILRDYEHVRIPMQRGDPKARPADTRNPTRGFLHMPLWFVEAMVGVGHLRWGAADIGPQESGDVHHFDLGFHALTPDGQP
jgi:hypothetical protein